MQIWEAAVEWHANSSSSPHKHTHKLILPKWLCQALPEKKVVAAILNQQPPKKEGRWEKWLTRKQLIITSTSICPTHLFHSSPSCSLKWLWNTAKDYAPKDFWQNWAPTDFLVKLATNDFWQNWAPKEFWAPKGANAVFNLHPPEMAQKQCRCPDQMEASEQGTISYQNHKGCVSSNVICCSLKWQWNTAKEGDCWPKVEATILNLHPSRMAQSRMHGRCQMSKWRPQNILYTIHYTTPCTISYQNVEGFSAEMQWWYTKLYHVPYLIKWWPQNKTGFTVEMQWYTVQYRIIPSNQMTALTKNIQCLLTEGFECNH